MHETFVSKPDLPECFFDEIMEEPLEGDIVLMNNLVIKRATAVIRWETGKDFGTFSSQRVKPHSRRYHQRRTESDIPPMRACGQA